jgi:general secretion pathway protein I
MSSPSRFSRSRTKPRRGFTLVEVLVALTIASVALMAALRASATLTISAEDLRLRTYALWSAENFLARIRVEARWDDLALGRRTADCPQGKIELVCESEVFSTPNPFFKRVEIYVTEKDASTRKLAKLTGFATNLP